MWIWKSDLEAMLKRIEHEKENYTSEISLNYLDGKIHVLRKILKKQIY